jgi:energy-coupling factor transport system ATP-binding protein
MSTAPLIEIQSISYSYPQKKDHGQHPALHNVSLRVERGEYLAVLGKNGSGKSTLARHCNALLVPDSGRVLVNGLDTRDAANWRGIRESVGIIFQNPDNQIIATIVEDDIAWALTVRGMPRELIRKRVEQALRAVSIEQLRRQPPHKLSGGQRQRLAIAGVLALQPDCIIADEATSMLDPVSRQEIVALLHQLNQEFGLTIIHVTHLLEEIVAARRVIVMEQGEIVQEATPATFFADLKRVRALGMAVPESLVLVERLRAAGLPIMQEAVTVEAIIQELTR